MPKNNPNKNTNSKDKISLSINPDTTPIIYTDRIHIAFNKYGVILDVCQPVGNKARIVTRLGMSHIHAKAFVTELGRLLAVTESQSSKGQDNN